MEEKVLFPREPTPIRQRPLAGEVTYKHDEDEPLLEYSDSQAGERKTDSKYGDEMSYNMKIQAVLCTIDCIVGYLFEYF